MLLNLKDFDFIRVVFVVNKVRHNWIMSIRSLTVLAIEMKMPVLIYCSIPYTPIGYIRYNLYIPNYNVKYYF